MKKRNVIIIGGDKRQKYLKDYLQFREYNVMSYGLFDWDDENDRLKKMILSDSVVVLPLPASRNDKTINMPFGKKEVTIDRLLSLLGENNIVIGGMIKGNLLNGFEDNNIPYYDFYDEDFITKNAVLTSYGFVKILLEHIDYAVPLGEYAVLGYGRVAREIADILRKLSCDVKVFARNPLKRNEAELRGIKAMPLDDFKYMAEKFDIVVNTIPFNIITKEMLKSMKVNCKIIELASAPYGVNFEDARKLSVDVIKAPGLPGKYTPKTAGELIGEKIEEFLQREDRI